MEKCCTEISELNKVFDNDYLEEYARLCILDLLPMLGNTLRLNKKDPPDIVGDRIGIEVTWAIEKKDAELMSLFDQYCGCRKEELNPTMLTKKDPEGKYYGFYGEEGNKKLSYCNFDAKQLDPFLIEKSIIKKTNDLNKKNQELDYFAVFIFNFDSYYFEGWTKNLIEAVKRETNQNRYQFEYYIIKDAHELFLINVKETTCKKMVIQDKQNEEWRINALMNLK